MRSDSGDLFAYMIAFFIGWSIINGWVCKISDAIEKHGYVTAGYVYKEVSDLKWYEFPKMKWVK